jgi:hypothetical protein
MMFFYLYKSLGENENPSSYDEKHEKPSSFLLGAGV